ncbi:hypothetical protein BpHYR1_034128 [Brachionus plicatilis]|uniref:Uncharacterized protein n=1 Tax=Brachionus plicatilis TaxID=10195 RepID=A0A3M7SAT6_BRAPC|nr:hypothetical protein BpHYR1_034128 [Brachionus plicatilis]
MIVSREKTNRQLSPPVSLLEGFEGNFYCMKQGCLKCLLSCQKCRLKAAKRHLCSQLQCWIILFWNISLSHCFQETERQLKLDFTQINMLIDRVKKIYLIILPKSIECFKFGSIDFFSSSSVCAVNKNTLRKASYSRHRSLI